MKTGFISLMGSPNTGKSMLLNQILDTKLSIVSNVPGTTRKNILGIYHDDNTEIVFTDTPGIGKTKYKLNKLLNKTAYFGAEDTDLIYFIVDANKSFRKQDQIILERLKEKNIPTFLILNKIDKLNKETIFKKISFYKDLYDFKEIIPVSALKGENIKTLLKVTKDYLPNGERQFDKNTITTATKESLIADRILEKALQLTKEEIPHSLTVLIENIKEKKTITTIHALIIVDRESIKKIIIGKNGSMIKEIGTRARKDIEELINNKVNLKLFVKVKTAWRDSEANLKEFGFTNE